MSDKFFVRVIDENGFFVRDDLVDELTAFTIETPCPDGFYLPKWDGTQWVEGKTAEEIEAIQTSVVVEKSADQRISELETLVLQMGGII